MRREGKSPPRAHSPPPRARIHGPRAHGATGRREDFELAHMVKNGLQTPEEQKHFWHARPALFTPPWFRARVTPPHRNLYKDGHVGALLRAFVWFFPTMLECAYFNTSPHVGHLRALFLCLGRELCTQAVRPPPSVATSTRVTEHAEKIAAATVGVTNMIKACNMQQHEVPFLQGYHDSR